MFSSSGLCCKALFLTGKTLTGAGEDECGTKLPVGDAAEMDLGDKLKRMQSLRAQVAAARREDRRLTRKEDEDHFEALCEQLDIGESQGFLGPPNPKNLL